MQGLVAGHVCHPNVFFQFLPNSVSSRLLTQALPALLGGATVLPSTTDLEGIATPGSIVPAAIPIPSRLEVPIIYEVLVTGSRRHGDGNGDLRGLTAKLDDLQWLGADCSGSCPSTPPRW